MPRKFNSMMTGNPFVPPKVGCVKGKAGQPLDLETYRELLAERLVFMARQEDDPEWALDCLHTELYREDLASGHEPGLSLTESASRIMQDADLRYYLGQIGVPGKLPERFPPNNPKAEEVYLGTDLDSWISSLLEKPYNPDR
jgi:hypothetical protein